MGNSTNKAVRRPSAASSQQYVEFQVRGANYFFIRSPVPCAEEVFDSICVLVTPTEDLKAQAALVGEKLLHSFVLLFNSKSGQGLRVEYLADNFGKVSVSHGCLARGEIGGEVLASSSVTCLHAMSNGFYRCNLTMESLLEFNSLFENLCEFDITDHNCHIYHRSLLATAIRGRPLYNIKDPNSNIALKAATTSQQFHTIDETFCNKAAMFRSMQKNPTSNKHFFTFHIRSLLSSQTSPVEVKTVVFNPSLHRRIQLGNVSYSDASNLSRAFCKFENALKEGSETNLIQAIEDCRSFKLYALADVGDILVKIFNELVLAQKARKKEAITRLLNHMNAMTQKFSEFGITADFQAFPTVMESNTILIDIQHEENEALKSFNWSLLNGDTEILRASTANLRALGFTSEPELGMKTITSIDKLAGVLESKSPNDVIDAYNEVASCKELENFWVFKKVRQVAQEHEQNIIASMLRRRRRRIAAIILFIIISLCWYYW